MIWLDIAIHIRLLRVLRRNLGHRGQSRSDLPESCPKRLDWTLLRWIWDTRRTVRANIIHFIAQVPPE